MNRGPVREPVTIQVTLQLLPRTQDDGPLERRSGTRPRIVEERVFLARVDRHLARALAYTVLRKFADQGWVETARFELRAPHDTS